VRILADYHHSDLFESYQLALADRFGWEIWRPIGMDWFAEDYWAFEKAYHGDAVAKQYLELWPDDTDHGHHWTRRDSTHPGRTHRMVTLDQARHMDWDVVISSVTANDPGFARFAREQGATFGLQAGNVGQLEQANWSDVAFCLASTAVHIPLPVPHIIYRQEFKLTDFRFEWPPAESKSVSSFVQCFAENKGFYDQFLAYARAWPEFDWQVYGAYGSHETDEFACGNLPTTPAVAHAMRATRIAWHAKWWSDGYGHVIHNLFACGRPVIGYADYYADKLAGPLWVDGVTSFDLSQHSPEEVLAELRRLRDDDDYHRAYCEAAAARFREVVDFAADAERAKELIESTAR